MKIKVAQIPKKKTSPSSLLATFCYHFPQYTLKEARKLPYKHVVLLINTANKMKALEYLNLLQISIAPNTKDGGKDLKSSYEDIINGT